MPLVFGYPAGVSKRFYHNSEINYPNHRKKIPSPEARPKREYIIYILLVHCAAALLVFLAAAAGAGIVRTYLCALADGATLFAAVGRAAG